MGSKRLSLGYQEIVQLMNEYGEPMTAHDLHTLKPDISAKQFAKCLCRMKAKGVIRRVSQGRYAPLPAAFNSPRRKPGSIKTYFALYDRQRHVYGELMSHDKYDARLEGGKIPEKCEVHVFRMIARKRVRVVRKMVMDDLPINGDPLFNRG